MPDVELLEHFVRCASGFADRPTGQQRHEQDVFPGGELLEQVRSLEHETEDLSPVTSPNRGRELRKRSSGEHDASSVGSEETGRDRQERGLSRAARALQQHDLAGRHDQ